jgi:hypothetical protein
MGFNRRAARSVPAFFLAVAWALGTLSPVAAQTATVLTGNVTADGRPVADADVTVSGANLTIHVKTDAQGAFTVAAIPSGTYDVDASASAGTARLRIDVPAAGATIAVVLSALKEIGRTAVVVRPPERGSGTDLNLNSQILSRSPANGNLPALLLQLPGAARGANGVVHINGDHGDVNYIVDGVPIPQELNRNIGSEIDPNDIAFLDAIEGAYPAQYGERFAAVINVNTRNGAGAPGFAAQLDGSSYTHLDGDLAYHAALGSGSLIVASRDERGTRGLDPPNPDSPHNDFSATNQFVRFTQPTGAAFLNFTVTHAYQTYQIPNDVAGGEPATTNDNETQDDLFASIQYRRLVGTAGSFSIGPSYKRSRIRDFGDPANDFLYGEALNPGAPTDCAQALSSTGPVVGGIVTNPVANPAVAYGNGSCGYSLFGDRTAIDTGAVADYDNRSDRHDVRFGGVYDATNVRKTYAITLQPGNFLAPIFTPATPNAAYTVVDTSPNAGHLAASYVQDTWTMGAYQLDYGLRSDTFLVSSAQFAVGYGQISPRLKLTRNLSPRSGVYIYYGRFFTPFSLENVSPVAAYTLNLPLQTAPAQFDLKPQRDSVYEIGGHLPLGKGDLGVRVMQKNATDLIDDTQVGVTNLHQDINYAQGRIATQSAYYQLGFARASRLYASVTHTYSVNRGCETQLLAPCFGQSDDWTPADHDQRIDVTSGLIANDRHGGWFAVDGEYGSGLSTGLNPNGGITCAGPGYASDTGGPCKFTPHLTFDTEKGIALSSGATLTLRVKNLLNDRYLVTYLNAQGNHEAPPRTFELGIRIAAK